MINGPVSPGINPWKNRRILISYPKYWMLQPGMSKFRLRQRCKKCLNELACSPYLSKLNALSDIQIARSWEAISMKYTLPVLRATYFISLPFDLEQVSVKILDKRDQVIPFWDPNNVNLTSAAFSKKFFEVFDFKTDMVE